MPITTLALRRHASRALAPRRLAGALVAVLGVQLAAPPTVAPFAVHDAVAEVPGFTEELLDYVQDRYGRAARERVADWEQLILEHRDRPVHEQLTIVNDFFNRMRFVSDQSHWGKRDYWATPIEFLGTRGGDCEDFSIAKYFTLKELGVPIERLRITYVRALGLDEAHMVVAYYETPDAEPLILDNLVEEVTPGSRRNDLVPVYSFNGDGLWKARERDAGRRVGGAGGLRLWRDLTVKMERERSPGSRAAGEAPAPPAQAVDLPE